MPEVVKRLTFADVKWRLNPKCMAPQQRVNTGLRTFDSITGGLPKGLTVILGTAGSGKSLLARNISLHSTLCLYFTCEVLCDAPSPDKHPNVITVDYTTHKPNWKRALEEVDLFITEMKPSIVIIDSLTAFLSTTNKAIPEADVPTGAAWIHSRYDNKLPILGISEIRGTDKYRSAAGGEGVRHKNSMLIEMDQRIVVYPSEAELYHVAIGDVVYMFRVVKDKHNVATTAPAKVILDNGCPKICLLRQPKAQDVVIPQLEDDKTSIPSWA